MRLTKTTLLPAVAGSLLLLAACNRTPDAHKAEATDAKEAAAPAQAVPYKVDLNKSNMTWIGAKLTESHNGTVQLSEGSILVTDEQVTGGKFVFDMASMRAEDLEMDQQNNFKLTGHLMSKDFFDVVHHPTAQFEITSVTPIGDAATSEDAEARKRVVKNKVSRAVTDLTHNVTGNLTIKGISKSITFPAQITVTESTATAKANFLIDRTDWKLNYQSEKSLADKMIYREVNIVLDIVANKP